MSDHAWREYWSGGGDASAAIEGANAERLAEFWRRFFGERLVANPSVIVDVAAGAGSALRIAHEDLGDGAAAPMLVATDISQSALNTMMRRLETAIGVACSSDALAFRDSCADIVISQFGIEYAGAPAFAEAARILSPDGAFCAVSHIAGGGIESECAENARLLDLALNSKLIDRAQAALARSFHLRREKRDAEPGSAEETLFSQTFTDTAAGVAAASDSAARRMLERFLTDLSRLAGRRLAFDEKDALGWLAGMKDAFCAYHGRMMSMTAAALGENDIREIGGLFSQRGFARFEASPMHLAGAGAPAAWAIRASRS